MDIRTRRFIDELEDRLRDMVEPGKREELSKLFALAVSQAESAGKSEILDMIRQHAAENSSRWQKIKRAVIG